MNRGLSTYSTPGADGSIRNSVGRRSAPSTTLAMTISTLATSPEVTNHFSPLMRQPASVATAVDAIPPGSDPASASVTA